MSSRSLPDFYSAAMAPGAPGIGPTWCSGHKELVGCSLGPSRLWFTIGAGIINEVYYPRVDIPQIRDLGFIVADGRGFWVEVKRLQSHRMMLAGPGVPAVTLVHEHSRFVLTLRIVPGMQRDVLLVDLQLDAEEGLRPYALLAPHLGGTGHGNTAVAGRYHVRKVLAAAQGPFALALAAVDGQQGDAWGRISAGYVGSSDGWQDFARNGAMTWEYSAAGPGNVALLGELPTRATLALGFATSEPSAATLAVSALLEPFERSWQGQVERWEHWHRRRSALAGPAPQLPAELETQLATSAMVLRVHQDKIYPGSMIASASIPWGNERDDRGGYHLVWPRDLVQSALALLELGGTEESRQILQYLVATQHTDGHWNQNQWLGGRAFWKGIQLDEAAFPVLLAAALHEKDQLGGTEIHDMVRRAVGFLARSGPASPQDRWEEDAGLNPFTVGVCIAALVSGAQFLQEPARGFALGLADCWNSQLEDWLTAVNSTLGNQHGVPRYYVRAVPEQILSNPQAIEWSVPIRNRSDNTSVPAREQISVDFLQLVRLGLRNPEDPLIVDTLRLADALLRREMPGGPVWYRYTGDGYGEHTDGRAYDGTGQGRPWPLLTGERGHYELCRGNSALPYLQAMAASASTGGMLPEQVWDEPDIPERLLFRGKPTGSATPLVWAHAEFVQLALSHRAGRPTDRPQAVWQRYGGVRPPLRQVHWFEHAPVASLPAGAALRICLREPGFVRASIDAQALPHELPTQDIGLGIHVTDLPVESLRTGQRITFDYRRADASWSGTSREIVVREPAGP